MSTEATTTVNRFDIGELGSAQRTPQGFLKVPGFVTRVGVFTYMDGAGQMRRELRHPDDVFAPESLETLKNAPVTIEHPPVMLQPSNVQEYMKGYTTDRVDVNRNLVETDVIVADQEAISKVLDDGMRQISSGYQCVMVPEVGEYEGAPYNFRQTRIRYNHVALVDRGRAGPEVRLRLDSADAVMQDQEIAKPAAGEFAQSTGANDAEGATQAAPVVGGVARESSMKKVVISGQEVDLPSDIAETIQDMLDRYDEIRARLMELEELMANEKKDKKDADISQPGVSPQVNVQQSVPDGREASGKVGAGDKSGAAKAKGDAEEEKGKKEDGEMSPVEKMKADMAAMKDSMDAMQAKIDAYASETMGKGEAKGDDDEDEKNEKKDGEGKEEKKDSAMADQIRARVRLERSAEKLVPFEISKKFDSMSDDEIRVAVIQHRNPRAELKGKSSVYLQSRFDSLVELADEEGSENRARAGRALMGAEGRMDSKEHADVSPEKARLAMISGTRELWKQPLSASKK